jgi:hypothetical protein
MDPIKAKFFQGNFDLEHGNNKINLRGLLSEQGITKIFLTGAVPDFWKTMIGQAVVVKLDSLTISGVLIQQFVEHGSYYEVRFRGLDENQKTFLRQRTTTEGISPGWQREFPRIPLGGLADPELPVPNLCMVRFAGQEFFVNVLNFTIGGIRIETIGNSLGQVRVGAILHFDLLTSTGEILGNLSGEVRNLSEHEHTDKTLTRSFGIRFVNLDPVNERKYKELIKAYCLILQKRLAEEK